MLRFLLIPAVVAFSCAAHAADKAVEDLLRQRLEAENLCRGTADNPEACEVRDRIYAKLYDLGWCYGKPGQAMYEMEWHQCAKPMPDWVKDTQRIHLSVSVESDYHFDGISAELLLISSLEDKLYLAFQCDDLTAKVFFKIPVATGRKDGTVLLYDRANERHLEFLTRYETSESMEEGHTLVHLESSHEDVVMLLRELHGGGEFVFRFGNPKDDFLIVYNAEPNRETRTNIGSMFQMCGSLQRSSG